MKLVTNAIFSHLGTEAAFNVLREVGFDRVGSDASAVAPLDAFAPGFELFLRASEVSLYCSQDVERTAVLTAHPWASICISWGDPIGRPHLFELANRTADALTRVGKLEFAAVHWADPEASDSDVFAYRSLVLCNRQAGQYAKMGPAQVGYRCWIGARLLGLSDQAACEALLQSGAASKLDHDTWLVETAYASGLGRPDVDEAWKRACSAFDDMGVFSRFAIERGIVRSTPGSRWKPLPEITASAPDARSSQLKGALQASVKGPLVEGVDGEGVKLAFAALMGARAEEVELNKAVLAFADLQECDFVDCGFIQADLRATTAQQARFHDCRFADADLRWGNFTGAALGTSTADRALLTGSIFRSAKLPDSLVDAVLDQAVLDEAIVEDCTLTGASLKGASCVATCFIKAHMDRASFAGADVSRADFSGASLRGADFRGARRDGALFDGADLTGALFDP